MAGVVVPQRPGPNSRRRHVLPPLDQFVQTTHETGDVVLFRKGQLRVSLRIDVDDAGKGLGDAAPHEVPLLPDQDPLLGNPLRDLDLGSLPLRLERSALQKIDLKAPLGVEVCGELDVNRILIDRLEVFEHPGHDGRKIRPGQQFVEGQDPDVLRRRGPSTASAPTVSSSRTPIRSSRASTPS